MPPYISRYDDENYPEGTRKRTFVNQVHQPHIFQQSVTLTAAIWNEDDSKENMENWNFGNWEIFRQYSPLIIGLFCGFGIVILVISTVGLWRFCLLSATKKVCCSYGELSLHHKNSVTTLRKDRNGNQNGFEKFRLPPEALEKSHLPRLKRCATLGTIPLGDLYSEFDNDSKFYKLRKQEFSAVMTPPNSQLIEPLMSQNSLHTSHSSLKAADPNASKMSRTFSKSTPALEDFYSKVNFSKKKKNRMRNDEAAVIAMSKSLSGQDSSLQRFCPAIVVYNERTAL